MCSFATHLPLGARRDISAGIGAEPRCPRGGGADDRARTGDLVLTKDALYLLSYIGALFTCVPSDSQRRLLERETGIEPATNSLEGCDSTTELLPPSRTLNPFASAGKPPVPRPLLRRRTHSIRSAHPTVQGVGELVCRPNPAAESPTPTVAGEGWWRGEDSNLRRR